MLKTAQNPAVPDSVYGKELLNSALYGAGLTASGAALYHLFNGLQSARVPELLRDEAPVAAKPKPTTSKRKRPAMKLASATELVDKVLSTVGGAIPKSWPLAGVSLPTSTAVPSPNSWHEGYRNTANILAAAAGGYGGLKLVNSIADKKKKEDLAAEVDTARKEYFDALTGKQAEVLDAAFDEIEKTSSGSNPLGGLWTTALLAGLGSGTIGATYMYNQTKARSRAENLRRAQSARARLRGLQQTPWVDPEQLAALAQNK
jgi:hypothetical protein